MSLSSAETCMMESKLNFLTIQRVVCFSALSNLWTVAIVCCANRGRTPKIWRITWTGERTSSPPSCRASCPPSSCRTTGASCRRRPRCSSGRRTWRRSRGWERSSWRRSTTASTCEATRALIRSYLEGSSGCTVLALGHKWSSWYLQPCAPCHDFVLWGRLVRMCSGLITTDCTWDEL